MINKKQAQEKEIFLYKLYNIALSRPKTLEPMFIQNEINNLEKYMKYMQSSVKMMLFYLPPHYKSPWPQGEQDKQYWNKIAIEFLKKKHNTDTTRKGLLIEMYTRGSPHKLYFIALILWGQIIIEPTKKIIRVVNTGLNFIFLSILFFIFISFFFFFVSTLFRVRRECDIICHRVQSQSQDHMIQRKS